MFFFAILFIYGDCSERNVSSVLKYFDHPMCDQFGKVFSDHDQIKQTNKPKIIISDLQIIIMSQCASLSINYNESLGVNSINTKFFVVMVF